MGDFTATGPQRVEFFIGFLLLFLSACTSVSTPHGPPIRVAMEEVLSADESPTGLPRSQIREIVELNFEDYVTRVVAAEVPSDWPAEALQAQAVASRSYALFLKTRPRSPEYDLVSSVHDQVFRATGRVPYSIRLAVRATAGQTLFINEQPLQAYFHSCCGGRTERPKDVWPTASEHPLQVSVADPYDAECPHYRWNYELSKVELLVLLAEGGHPIADFVDIVPRSLTPAGRIQTFRFVGPRVSTDIPANELRRVIGYAQLKSTNFRMEEDQTQIIFAGQGAGHGVGMCQWGARGMALAGFTYDQILDHFYPGATLKPAY